MEKDMFQETLKYGLFLGLAEKQWILLRENINLEVYSLKSDK